MGWQIEWNVLDGADIRFFCLFLFLVRAYRLQTRRHTHGEDDDSRGGWTDALNAADRAVLNPLALLSYCSQREWCNSTKMINRKGKKQIRIRSLCGGEDTIHVQVGLTWCRAPWTHTWIMNIMCDGLSWSACACQGNCNNLYEYWMCWRRHETPRKLPRQGRGESLTAGTNTGRWFIINSTWLILNCCS